MSPNLTYFLIYLYQLVWNISALTLAFTKASSLPLTGVRRLWQFGRLWITWGWIWALMRRTTKTTVNCCGNKQMSPKSKPSHSPVSHYKTSVCIYPYIYNSLKQHTVSIFTSTVQCWWDIFCTCNQCNTI